MRYVGGKSKIAKQIVAQMPIAGRRVWEPFCGGLWVSAEIAKAKPESLICTDACEPLISLYKAVQAGWIPPSNLTETQYAEAKQLPNTDPLKAFVGFGCSFGGKWFGGYARAPGRNFVDEAARGVIKHLDALKEADFRTYNFLTTLDLPLSELTSRAGVLIYCDPPYASTETYKATDAFDHEKFWKTCKRWAGVGAAVYVSEYSCPFALTPIWSKAHALNLAGRGCEPGKRMENLYRVLP